MAGRVIIFPTDTVYGIGSSCFSTKGINDIFKIKIRDKNKPINVLTDSVDKINLVVNKINNKEKELIDKYMPGGLTIIFDKKESISNILTANLNTVGVRIPNNNIALKILSNYKYPLAVTSANISGEKEYINADDCIKEFMGKVDIIIDGGESNLKIPSTIVRVDGNNIKVLREGSIKVID